MSNYPKNCYIEVTGGRVWYEIIGDGPGLPLITLHGGPGSSHFGLEPLKALGADRPIVFYDQLGCGNSDRPDDPELWHIDRFVDELLELITSLGFKQFHILGHSWGTMLATDYYLSHPKGITSLIFSSPCLSVPLWLADCNRYRVQLPNSIKRTLEYHETNGSTDSEDYRNATKEFNKRHVLRLETPPLPVIKGRENRGAQVYKTMWGDNEFFMDGNLKDYDRTDRLSSFKIPTLYSCGRFDEASPDTVKIYSDLTPTSEFHVYENSAHMPHWEDPDEYLATVREFLIRCEA